MNLTYTEYDVSKKNVGETLEFLASEHVRIVNNLRMMLDTRDELLAEVYNERAALQAWIDAVPVDALCVVVGGLYQALRGDIADAPNDALERAVAWVKAQVQA